jgi:hypothetical protein
MAEDRARIDANKARRLRRELAVLREVVRETLFTVGMSIDDAGADEIIHRVCERMNQFNMRDLTKP